MWGELTAEWSCYRKGGGLFTLAPGLVEGRGEGGRGGGNGDFKSWMSFENLNCIEQCPQINPQVFLKDCVCPMYTGGG